MRTDEKPFLRVGDSQITVDGEILDFVTRTVPVVRNRTTGRYGIHVQMGHNSTFFIQPIRKNGTLGATKPHWTREDGWLLVGKVDRHTAYSKEMRLPGFISRLFGGEPKEEVVPRFEWTENLKIFPEADWLIVFLLGDFLRKHRND